MISKLRRTLVAIALGTLCSVAMVAASGQADQPDADEPFTVTILTRYASSVPPDFEDPMFARVEELTGFNMDVQATPLAEVAQKLDVLIASRDLPMSVFIPDRKRPSIIAAARNGLFWEVGEYAYNGDYPNLSTMPDATRVSGLVDGRDMFLHQDRPSGRPSIIYRKDWADNLGLSAPTTLDELYDLLWAFTYDDPDGNGVDDTMGMAMGQFVSLDSDFDRFSHLMVWAGNTPMGWGVIDGEMTFAPLTPGWKDGMDFVKRLLDDGLVNSDFAAGPNFLETYVYSGIAGTYGGVASDLITHPSRFAADDVQLDAFSIIEGRNPNNNGIAGSYGLTTSAIETEADLAQVLEFYDALSSPEIMGLLRYGIPGIHCEFTDESERYVRRSPDSTLLQRTALFGNQLHLSIRNNFMPDREPAGATGRADELHALNAANPDARLNVAFPFISETYSNVGPQLNEIVTAATTRYIYGEIDWAGYQAAMEQWRREGGDQVITEYQAEYDRTSGN